MDIISLLGFILFSLIIFFIVYEISYEQNKEPFGKGNKDLPIFNLQKTRCFGHCPVYDVAIYPDGTVSYNGVEDVPRIGYYQFKLPKQQLTEIINDIKNLDITKLQTTYDGNITDMPTNILTFYSNPIKKIKARYNIPEKLSTFINKINKIIINKVK